MNILKTLVMVIATGTTVHAVAADFSFDRPGSGFSTGITPVGQLAWEQGLPTATYSESTVNGEKQKTVTLNADMMLRTGLAKDLELQLGWQGPSWYQHDRAGVKTHDNGLGDMTVGLKKAIDLNDDRLTMAVLAQALIATGDDAFSQEDNIYSLSSAVAYQYSDLLQTSITMKYEVQDSDWAVTAIPQLGYKFGGKWSGYSEFVYKKAESQDYQYDLGTGIIYALNSRAQLDGSVGVNLNGNDKGYRGGLGFSYLF